ncbi:hypothetical protein I553_7331 [Mycobacterium xenopi 4042]|uniref:Uncharacterized protein n=1 Tax=Mycobacterium xenopi 4042 TaxID=1299334 RepID=X8E8A3_MYCXE|nr:hypothetical protein I553_7331 [Mycobacterium xenopi 4042]
MVHGRHCRILLTGISAQRRDDEIKGQFLDTIHSGRRTWALQSKWKGSPSRSDRRGSGKT